MNIRGSLIAGVGLLALLMLGLAPQAQAGTYPFNPCVAGSSNDGGIEAEATSGLTEFDPLNPTAPYDFRIVNNCNNGSELKLEGTTSWSNGEAAAMKYETFAGMGFVGGSFQANEYIFETTGAKVRYWLTNKDGSGAYLLKQPTTGGSTQVLTSEWPSTPPRQVVKAQIKCESVSCSTGTRAAWGLIQTTISDYTAPEYAGASGSMFNPGAVSGTRNVKVDGIDGQSGVRSLFVLVNYQWAGIHTVGCTTNTRVMSPCPQLASHTFSINTASAAFQPGVNTLDMCVADYQTAGSFNTTCDRRYVTK